MKSALPRLWLVTDRGQVTGDLVTAVERSLSGLPKGAAAVILREKDLGGRSLLDLAGRLRRVTRLAGALLVVNGRLDVAVAAEADGVQLGGDAPAFAEVRRSTRLLVGVSIHGAESPPPKADYALLAPVFATASKPGVAGLGLAALQRASRSTAVPIVALGGVNASNAAECMKHGARGVATLGAVLPAADPAGAAGELFALLSV